MSTESQLKQKFTLEYILKTSTKVLENIITTPNGLADWFAEDVKVVDKIYTFTWDGSHEKAKLIGRKASDFIRWQWISEDEDDALFEDTYFEFHYHIDPVTQAVILQITDFALEEEMKDSKRMWENAVVDLRRVLGA